MTIVVPTMWRAEGVHSTIRQVLQKPLLSLVLIDNKDIGLHVNHPSIQWIKPNSNLMVNRSWNLGVAFAKDSIVCLLNDDIEVNLSVLADHVETWFEDPGLGMVVFNATCVDGRLNQDTDVLTLNRTDQFGYGYGCLMVFRKFHWSPVPSSLQVFCGDDWIRYHIRHRLCLNTAEIEGLHARGLMEATSKDYQHLMASDVSAFEQLCKYESY